MFKGIARHGLSARTSVPEPVPVTPPEPEVMPGMEESEAPPPEPAVPVPPPSPSGASSPPPPPTRGRDVVPPDPAVVKYENLKKHIHGRLVDRLDMNRVGEMDPATLRARSGGWWSTCATPRTPC